MVPLEVKAAIMDDVRHADALLRLKNGRSLRGLAGMYGKAERTIRNAIAGKSDSFTDDEIEQLQSARDECAYLDHLLKTTYSRASIAARHNVHPETIRRIKTNMIDCGTYKLKPKRVTLSAFLRDETDATIDQFSRALGIPRKTIERWWQENRFLFRCLVSGYKKEVQGHE